MARLNIRHSAAWRGMSPPSTPHRLPYSRTRYRIGTHGDIPLGLLGQATADSAKEAG
ncbi:hypothetical protein [Accumulibacter sp.]|uniref:hypothetical protein n=1 Tax=Accumulibacter sp. TaxID=2053492 RepID=UPI00260169CF|nr:hypothetical protein [Accumulibacter sp.]